MWWEIVTRRFTATGAARTAARYAREGRDAYPAMLPFITHGWGYMHDDDGEPEPVYPVWSA